MREIVLDTETTGLDFNNGDRIIEVGCVELVNHISTGNNLQFYCSTDKKVSEEALKISGLSNKFLSQFPSFSEQANKFLNFIKNDTLIIHNAKFDMSFLKYEFGFEFPSFEDTMLLHYCLEEAVGTHGLKQLAMRFTDLGDYEKDLNDYKKTFARKNKIKLEDFNYGMFPVDILAPYACKDADGTFQLFNKF